jgi:hypothetical protein
MVVRSFEIRDFGARASLPDFPIGQDAHAPGIGRPPHGPLDDVTNAGVAISVEMNSVVGIGARNPVFGPVAEVMKKVDEWESALAGNFLDCNRVAFQLFVVLGRIRKGRSEFFMTDRAKQHEPDFGVLA